MNKKIKQDPEKNIAVDQSALFSRYASFFSATVSKNEILVLFGEKNTLSDNPDFIIHTKIAMNMEAGKMMLELLSSLINKAEGNEK